MVISVENEVFSQGWQTWYEEKGGKSESALRWKDRVVGESRRTEYASTSVDDDNDHVSSLEKE